jgi:hypothetical protein
MDNNHIKALGEYFYSSNTSKDVPLRLSVLTGMSGFDMDREQFERLLSILENSIDLTRDLSNFLNSYDE